MDKKNLAFDKMNFILLAIGMSWPQIMQITGLTEEQLKQLKS